MASNDINPGRILTEDARSAGGGESRRARFGSGFAGLCQLQCLRTQRLSVKVYRVGIASVDGAGAGSFQTVH
ncbi:hypothetical protein, partial [Mycolicibacterium mucogenicum]|uniref:hypothetical protein n=1 Tax=Mycolicibacterium mucogenicum TaxID=56689 RepID=UPI00194FB05A